MVDVMGLSKSVMSILVKDIPAASADALMAQVKEIAMRVRVGARQVCDKFAYRILREST